MSKWLLPWFCQSDGQTDRPRTETTKGTIGHACVHAVLQRDIYGKGPRSECKNTTMRGDQLPTSSVCSPDSVQSICLLPKLRCDLLGSLVGGSVTLFSSPIWVTQRQRDLIWTRSVDLPTSDSVIAGLFFYSSLCDHKAFARREGRVYFWLTVCTHEDSASFFCVRWSCVEEDHLKIVDEIKVIIGGRGENVCQM